MNDPETKDETIEVIVDRNQVTLRGIVRSEEVKEAAEREARDVQGVVLLVNELEVAPKDNTGGGLPQAPPPFSPH
ncbi:MAG: BON domain-containing protein [Chloroflexi bacterium]|nr:BON domain-containing protein [Chloroflexota bacterium]